MKKIVAVTVVFLLLPLLALHAQRLTTPEQLAPTLDQLTHPTARSLMKKELSQTSIRSWPEMDEPEVFHGPVHRVHTIYEIPDTVRKYAYFDGYTEKKIKIYDILQSKTTQFTYSQEGELQMIDEKQVLNCYYLFYRNHVKLHRKLRRNSRLYEKITPNVRPQKKMKEQHDEFRWQYKDGQLVSYNHDSEKPDYQDSLHFKYNNHGKLIDAYHCWCNLDICWDERIKCAYDTLGRLVCATNDKYVTYNEGKYAYLYDSNGCIAKVQEQAGKSLGNLNQLHYEPQPDGSLTVRVTWCEVKTGGDISEYAALYEHPDSCIVPFFSKRLTTCNELECNPHQWEKTTFPYSEGDYTFDTAGRLTGYCLRKIRGIKSKCTLHYDQTGRLVEIKALIGKIVFPKDFYKLSEGGILINGTYRHLQFAYDDHGQLSEVSWTDGSEETHSLSIRYTYDERDNWIRRETWRDGRQTGAVRREIEYAE